MGQIGQRMAIACHQGGLLLQQGVEVIHQSRQLTGRGVDEGLVAAGFELQHGPGQPIYGAQTPLGHQPDDGEQDKEIEYGHLLEGIPHRIIVLFLLGHHVHQYHLQGRQDRTLAIVGHHHCVGVLIKGRQQVVGGWR